MINRSEVFFSSKLVEKTEYPRFPLSIDSVMNIILVLDPDVRVHERQVYDVLSYIGDVGGLYGGLVGLCQIVMQVAQALGYCPLLSHMVKGVFRGP